MIFNLLQSPIDFLAILVGFLVIGITIHEYAHAWVANRSGDETARLMGRMTLNPLAHLDPIGTVMFLVVGFGWGKPVPLNPMRLHTKSDELRVAIAGIVANLLVATVLAIPIRIASYQGIIVDSVPILAFIKKLVEINVILAAFNILPVPPLDGSHFVEYFLSEYQKMQFRFIGQYALIGLILFDIVTRSSILVSIMEPIIRVFMFIVSGMPLN